MPSPSGSGVSVYQEVVMTPVADAVLRKEPAAERAVLVMRSVEDGSSKSVAS